MLPLSTAKKLNWWAIFSLIALLPGQSFAQQSNIDRLFFTPQERQRLDSLRLGKGLEFQPTETQSQPGPKAITLNGTLQKRGGSLRAWLNNTALDAADFNIPANVGRQLTAEGGLPLQLPSGLTANPKVGQQVNIRSGAVSESYLHDKTPPLVESTTELEQSNQATDTDS